MASAQIGQRPLVIGNATNLSLHRFGMTHNDEHDGIVAYRTEYHHQIARSYASGAATLIGVRRVAVIG